MRSIAKKPPVCWTAVVCSMLYVAAVSVFVTTVACEVLLQHCMLAPVYSLSLFLVNCGALLIPVKFTFAGLGLMSGYQTITGGTERYLPGKTSDEHCYFPQIKGHLRRAVRIRSPL